MLRPTKHSHPDRTVIYASLMVLARLKKRRVEDYESLRRYAKRMLVGGDALFLPALNFLYLMGLVEYRIKTDSIEFVGPNETV